MRGLIPHHGPWFMNVNVAVMDLADWNRLFSGYPATLHS